MQEKLTLSSLAKGLANNEFIFYYQPIISLSTGKISGAESLLRWNRPDGSVLLPGSFIPLAEKTGFITEFTHEMLPKLVQDLQELNIINDTLNLSLNVSAKDFEDENFLPYLQETVTEKLINPKNVCIEITETAFLPTDPKTKRVLHDIDDMGISIVLNDFTSGFTDFSTLTTIPIKAIKISMEVTQKAPISGPDFRLFRHLVSMAHQLNLDIIAEGVENLEIHTIVLATGCTHTQGFYYARPKPFSELVDIIKQDIVWSKYPLGAELLAQFDHIDFRRDVIRAALMIFNYPDKDIRAHVYARLPELDYRKCQFGMIYEMLSKLNHGEKSYAQVVRRHKEFHDIANSLLEIAHRAESWDELQQKIVIFSKKSKSILSLIQDMEIEQLQNYFSPG